MELASEAQAFGSNLRAGEGVEPSIATLQFNPRPLPSQWFRAIMLEAQIRGAQRIWRVEARLCLFPLLISYHSPLPNLSPAHANLEGAKKARSPSQPCAWASFHFATLVCFEGRFWLA